MLKLEFTTGNAAYTDDSDTPQVMPELVGDTVWMVYKQLSEGFTSGQVLDANGAHVGWWSLTDSDEEDTVTLPRAEVETLRERTQFLARLEAAGVDNWEGYSEA